MSGAIISVALYAFTVFVVICMMLAFAWFSSASYNQRRAMQWFESMDVAQDGQRYLGSRAIVLANVDSEKKSALSYEIFLACRTPSKRAFYISVISTFGMVTAWQLIPVAYNEIIVDLKEMGFEIDNEEGSRKDMKTNTPETLSAAEKKIAQENSEAPLAFDSLLTQTKDNHV